MSDDIKEINEALDVALQANNKKIIPVRKGLTNIINVGVSYLVSYTALWVTKKSGVEIPADLITEAQIGLTMIVAGLVTSGLNWWKHRGDK